MSILNSSSQCGREIRISDHRIDVWSSWKVNDRSPRIQHSPSHNLTGCSPPARPRCAALTSWAGISLAQPSPTVVNTSPRWVKSLLAEVAVGSSSLIRSSHRSRKSSMSSPLIAATGLSPITSIRFLIAFLRGSASAGSGLCFCRAPGHARDPDKAPAPDLW